MASRGEGHRSARQRGAAGPDRLGVSVIERIVIENFKSLRKVDLSLGRMNLFIGTNASGKSNFLDALRVLQGIGSGFTISEILDGKPRSASSDMWEGIRGGSSRIRLAGADRKEVRITVEGRIGRQRSSDRTRRFMTRRWKFQIDFSPEEGKINQERLQIGSNLKDLYDSAAISSDRNDPILEVRYFKNEQGRPPHLKFERSRSVLAQFAAGGSKWKESDADFAKKILDFLANSQRIDPSPRLLRDYSQAHRILRMGERGENFAALVKTLCEDDSTKDAYLSWLRQLRPEEVDDVGTLSGARWRTIVYAERGWT